MPCARTVVSGSSYLLTTINQQIFLTDFLG
jgi:hypothetical protein